VGRIKALNGGLYHNCPALLGNWSFVCKLAGIRDKKEKKLKQTLMYNRVNCGA